ncbi:MAG: phosphoenolpyruvate--protein phosphotransferase [Alphaproteobacteria bacterium]
MSKSPSPPQTIPTSRRLLARVRDVMAGSASPKERLNETVSIIAADAVAEVCSIYVLRAGEVLELFATEGLSPDAVHNTRLRIGEGLIGVIAAQARPMAFDDAPSHPDFVFRPETGEAEYQSLMGVPIMRGGRVIGVIAVQNKISRQYTEEEIETLQTVAMVVAELVSGGDLIARAEQLPADGNALLPLRIEGMALNPGIGIGVAVSHRAEFHITNLVADDIEGERERLRLAVSEMHGALDALLDKSDIAGGGEHRDILESYRMIAEDAGWFARIDEAITTGLTAEAAVQKVHNEIRARMSQITDPYLRERVHDLEDLAGRLLQHLLGESATAPDFPETGTVILIARNMGPAQLLDYDRTRLGGLVLEEGSATAHVSIVARALDIPVVGQARDVLDKIETGEPVIVDGGNGQVFLRPGEEVQQRFRASLKAREKQLAAYAQLRDLPAVTTDGVDIGLFINAGLLIDLPHMHETGADGVGLYRTEVPFMVSSDFPNVDEQTALYSKVLAQADGKPVTFRTLDIGGDKVLPYVMENNEENPAMGWRAIRVSLDRPIMLRHQLRALIRASVGTELRVMFPMIADVHEFQEAKKLLDKELERARGRDENLPDAVKVGVMIEVPSLLFQLPALLSRLDFVSIGSNDLCQFLFAADRGNPLLSDRYDPLSPAILSLFSSIAEQCEEASVALNLCGEMAASPLDAMALIGAGLRNLSMAPNAVGPVKAMVRSLSAGELTHYLQTMYASPRRSLRRILHAFAKDHGVVL